MLTVVYTYKTSQRHCNGLHTLAKQRGTSVLMLERRHSKLTATMAAGRLADRIQGEMYFACAQHDIYASPETLVKLQQVIDLAKIDTSIEVYEEAHHGFAFHTRKSVYNKHANERHWERLFDLFRRKL